MFKTQVTLPFGSSCFKLQQTYLRKDTFICNLNCNEYRRFAKDTNQ